MLAVIDWFSHTTHGWIWLVSCVGLTPFETVFQSISGRLPKREKGKKKDTREKNYPNNPHPYLLQAQ